MEQISGTDIAQVMMGTLIEGILQKERQDAHERVLRAGTEWISNSPDWLGLGHQPQEMERFSQLIAELIVSCARAAACIEATPELPLDWGA